MVRYPDGLTGQRFFQKNASSYFPRWIRRIEVAKEDGTVEHVSCDKAATAPTRSMYLTNSRIVPGTCWLAGSRHGWPEPGDPPPGQLTTEAGGPASDRPPVQ